MAEVQLSVVVPVYGCRGCLRPLLARLNAALEPIVGDDFEVVFIDDRSPDAAWEELLELAREDRHVRAVRLSRNFGQHAAITAGLSRSQGRHTVVMDCDLEEPPEVIPRLYAKAREGFDIVHTSRTRPTRPGVRHLLGRAYFRLRNVLLGTRTGTEHGTLSLLSRPVVNAFLLLRDRDREYLVALDWLGFRSTTVEFERAPRHEGRSSYTWRRLLRVGIDGLFFQTTVLLRWVVLAGLLIALAGVGLATYYLYTYFASDPLPGYTSLAVLMLLLSGFIIVTLGVVGMYVGKVFEQVKDRPLFVIDQEVAGEDAAIASEPTVEEVPR